MHPILSNNSALYKNFEIYKVNMVEFIIIIINQVMVWKDWLQYIWQTG